MRDMLLNILNRYLEKTLENYKEETGIRVQFSVEMVCEALRDWSANNQLSEQVAHNVYASICRELGEVAESGVIEVGVAGANCRMRQADSAPLLPWAAPSHGRLPANPLR